MDIERITLITVREIELAHEDDRGSISDVLNTTIGHVGYVTFTKGSIRGMHYHHESTQYDYILSGKLRLITCMPDGSSIEEHILVPGMATEIPPGVVHTYIAEEDSVMLDMTTLGREGDAYEKDTVRVDLQIF